MCVDGVCMPLCMPGRPARLTRRPPPLWPLTPPLVSASSLFRNLEEVEKLSELGVLFLLFEMGLELSIDRLRVGGLGCSGTVDAARARAHGQPCRQQRRSKHGQTALPPACAALPLPALPICVQALAKFAFGMGTLQMVLCTVVFSLVGLPPGESLFTQVRRPAVAAGMRGLVSCTPLQPACMQPACPAAAP